LTLAEKFHHNRLVAGINSQVENALIFFRYFFFPFLMRRDQARASNLFNLPQDLKNISIFSLNPLEPLFSPFLPPLNLRDSSDSLHGTQTVLNTDDLV